MTRLPSPARNPQDRALLPFGVLLHHFFQLFFDQESLSPQGDSTTSFSQILGLLAVPGAFFIILFWPFAEPGWMLVIFRYFFVSFSMIVTGFAVVFKWDALFPDRRDYLILNPLPLSRASLFGARVAALSAFLCLILVAANAISLLFWPAIDSRHSVFAVWAAHLTVVISGSLFAALAAAAVQGILATLFTGALYRRISVTVQTLLLATFVLLLVLIPLMGPMFRFWVRADRPIVHWFPPYWFVGLYELLLPTTRNTALQDLGYEAMNGLLAVSAIFVVTYLPGYFRHARRALDTPAPRPSGPGLLVRSVSALLHRTLLRQPLQRAVFHFISETIARSMKHRLFLALYGGFGVAVGILSFKGGPEGMRELPFILSFVLVSGLRAAFNFPSELRANWAFQITDPGSASHAQAATRKWIVLHALAPFYLCIIPVELQHNLWPEALFHAAFGFALAVLLVQVMFIGFIKVPFTCAWFPGKFNFVGLSALYIFGFTMYSRTMSRLEVWLFDHPALAASFFGLVLAAGWALGFLRNRLMRDETLDYEDARDPLIRSLDLSEGA